MKPFGNKFFILFLILTVSLFFFSARVAYAGDVIDAIGSVFNAIVTVTNTVINAVLGVSEIIIGTIIGVNPLAGDGECRLQALEQNIFQVFGDSCNTSASIVVTPTGDGCTFSYQPKFYIPSFNWGFISDQYQGCDRVPINETNNNVALYRFVKPSSISQSELSDWYFNIKNNVGNGFVFINWPQTVEGPSYHQSADSGPLVTLPYYTSCSGNVCDKIADFSIPPDSYVVYAAKILGDYTGSGTDAVSGGCYSVQGSNKFFDTDNNNNGNTGGLVWFPSPNGLGNALIGPIKTGSCPTPPPATPPTASISADSTNIAYNTATTIRWSSTNATSCTYTGPFWPGASVAGSGQSANLTSNTTFTMQCTGPGGTSPVASVTVNVGAAPSVAPAPPTNASASAVSCSQIDVSWTDNSNNEDRFGIELSMNGVDWPTWAGWVGPNITNFSHTGLSASTRYYYRIRSYNPAGGYGTGLDIVSAVTPACGSAFVPAPTLSFWANPTSITQGYSSTLNWNTSNASSCYGSGGGIDDWKSTGGNETVWPSSNTTYYMECWNDAGTSSGQKSATVNVSGAPASTPTLNFWADNTSISYNTGTTLRWNSSNTDSCTASGDWSGSRPLNDSRDTGDLTSSKIYNLTCSGPGGSAFDSVTVNVGGAPAPGAPSVNISADSTNLSYNTGTTIRWSSSNTTSCTVSPSGWTGTSGAQSTGNLTSSRTYTANCSGPGGSALDSVTVNVSGAPASTPTLNFWADNTSISYNTGTTLRWNSSNTTSCTASGDWSGSRPLNDSRDTGDLTSSKTYNLTCTGPGGSAFDSVTVNVGGAPVPAPTLSFWANPTSITQGYSSTLNWNTSNASSCYGSGGGIDGWKNTNGNETVWPSSNTTYYMECWNDAGTSSGQKNATVNVSAPPPGNFNLNLGGSVACNAAPLSWTASSGANAYRILRGSSRVDISPYQPYTARNFTDTTISQNTSYLYQIEAYSDSGTTRSNALNVDTPYCQPTVSLSANPTNIFQGQSVTLSWATSYTTSCIASNGWSGSKPLNGSEAVLPSPPPSATYNLTCSGPGGSASTSVTIEIIPLELPDWKEIIPR